MTFIPIECYGTISEIKGEARLGKGIQCTADFKQKEKHSSYQLITHWSRCHTGATEDLKDLFCLQFEGYIQSFMMR